MKNVTISMDEELIQLLRVKSAKAGKSVSKYVSQLVEKAMTGEKSLKKFKNAQMEALESIWSRPRWDVTTNGRMPTAEERNSRD